MVQTKKARRETETTSPARRSTRSSTRNSTRSSLRSSTTCSTKSSTTTPIVRRSPRNSKLKTATTIIPVEPPPPPPPRPSATLQDLLDIDLVASQIMQHFEVRDLVRIMRVSQGVCGAIISYLTHYLRNLDYQRLRLKSNLQDAEIVKLLQLVDVGRLNRINLTDAASFKVWEEVLDKFPTARELNLEFNSVAKLISFATVIDSLHNLNKVMICIAGEVIGSLDSWKILLRKLSTKENLEWFGIKYRDPSWNLLDQLVTWLNNEDSLKDSLCPKIQELHLGKSDTRSSNLSELINLCPNLEILDLQLTNLSEAYTILSHSNVTKVKNFTVTVSNYNSIESFQDEVIKKMPQLRVLNIERDRKANRNFFHVFDLSKLLSSLSLTEFSTDASVQTGRITPEIASNIGFQTIKKINFDGHIGKDEFFAILSNCPNLQHLRAGKWQQKQRKLSSIKEFPQIAKGLKSLELAFTPRTPLFLGKIVPHLTALKRLNLTFQSASDIKFLNKLFKKCDSIEHLTLKRPYTQKASSLSLPEAMYDLSHLKILNLYGFTYLNAESIRKEFINKSKPNVKVLQQ